MRFQEAQGLQMCFKEVPDEFKYFRGSLWGFRYGQKTEGSKRCLVHSGARAFEGRVNGVLGGFRGAPRKIFKRLR